WVRGGGGGGASGLPQAGGRGGGAGGAGGKNRPPFGPPRGPPRRWGGRPTAGFSEPGGCDRMPRHYAKPFNPRQCCRGRSAAAVIVKNNPKTMRPPIHNFASPLSESAGLAAAAATSCVPASL